MGKPIAGRGQRPFNIGGILVNGAKSNGNKYIKNIYIYKQRSYNIYDLIDEMGVVHEYMEFVYRDADGNMLNYSDLDADITESLAEGTFYIKEQDPSRGIYGFSTLYQYNKIKINTGDYIFRDSEEFDYSLLSVQVIPYSININVGDVKTFDIKSLPVDYQNLTGEWTIDNECLSPISSTRATSFTVKANSVGDAIISYTPDANTTLTSFAHVKVLEKPIVINNLNVVYPDGGNNRGFAKGEEFTLRIISNPLDERLALPAADIINYDEKYFELINVSDDNKYYTFKVISDEGAAPYNPYMGAIRKSIAFSFTIDGVKYDTSTFRDIDWIHIVTKSDKVKFKISTNSSYVKNEDTITLYATYDKNLYILDPDAPIEWIVEKRPESGGDGTLNPISKFVCEYTAPPSPASHRSVGINYKGYITNIILEFYDKTYAKSVRIAPFDVNTMKPGDSVQLSPVYDPVDFVPPEKPVWSWQEWGDVFSQYADLTPDGLLTVKQEIPGNTILSPRMIVYDAIYGTVVFSKSISATKEDIKPTEISIREIDAIYLLPFGQNIYLSVKQYPATNSYIKVSYEWDDPSWVSEDKESNAYQLSNYFNAINTGSLLTFKPLRTGTHTITFWFDAFPEEKYSRTFTIY